MLAVLLTFWFWVTPIFIPEKSFPVWARFALRLNPLAFVVEQAGGAAYDGAHRVMDVQPTELHQRTPLFIGSKREVDLATELLSGVAAGVGG